MSPPHYLEEVYAYGAPPYYLQILATPLAFIVSEMTLQVIQDHPS